MYGTASLSEIHVQDNNNNFAFYLMKVLLMQIQQYSLPVALQWSSIYTDDMIQRRYHNDAFIYPRTHELT